MLNLPITNQDDVDHMLKHHGRLRDFHTGAYLYGWSAWIVLSNILAESINATLIAIGHPNFDTELKLNSTQPRIFPGQRIFGAGGWTVEFLWKRYEFHLKHRLELPVFVQEDALAFGFVYCSVPRRKWDSSWNFTIFTDPLGYYSWIGMLLALILTTLVLSFSRESRGILPSFFSTLSVLLTNFEESGVPRYSKIFILWMMTCMLLVNFYSGEMTGQIVLPPQEDKMTRWEELEKHNYSVIFNKPFVLDIMNNTVRTLATKKFVREDIKILYRLLGNSLLFPVGDSVTKFLPIMTEGDNKYAEISGWPFVMWTATTANQLRSNSRRVTDPASGAKTRRKKCYVGQELIQTGEQFFTVLPPGSAYLAGVFQRLAASGIVARWVFEFAAIQYSRRVQDRARVTGKTKLLEDQETTIEPLDMEGKTVTIFLLWIFCLAGGFVAFMAEIWLGRKTKIEPSNIAKISTFVYTF